MKTVNYIDYRLSNDNGCTIVTTSQYGNDADQKHSCAIFLLACLHIKETNCCATNHERWKNISPKKKPA